MSGGGAHLHASCEDVPRAIAEQHGAGKAAPLDIEEARDQRQVQHVRVPTVQQRRQHALAQLEIGLASLQRKDMITKH